ncbi:UNVERIFIED_CONTAM: Actin-related protein 6 [Sesamum latifolium]|uniref:Actin-related protein 6 n=1 Tax=Sesamum latifolium TaxID=2727402 RepID=A0AAW2XDI3_9LAMI
MDLGGKALTNYLKELVSYRSVNVMDESFIMDDVKEKLCFVSLDVQRDLKIARKPGKDNMFRCTYVLPDGVTYMKGFVKDPNEQADTWPWMPVILLPQPEKRRMNQAGLAECIVRSVNSCHPHLHPVLYESIILTGGSTLFPRFAERLEKELRPLVPDEFQVKITAQEYPILGVWRGGSLLASSPDFEAMCVTKAEYEELGSARCRRRFLH